MGQLFIKHIPGSSAFLAQGERAGRLRNAGVVVNGTLFTLSVVEPADRILLTVKYHHLRAAVETMRPEEILAESFPAERILYGMSLATRSPRNRCVRFTTCSQPPVFRALWWKFMINVGINQVSAVLELTYEAFQRRGYAHRLMESAMREVIAIAQQRGIDLGDTDIANWNQIVHGGGCQLNPLPVFSARP